MNYIIKIYNRTLINNQVSKLEIKINSIFMRFLK